MDHNPKHPHGFGPTPIIKNIPKEIRGGLWCLWVGKPKHGRKGKFDKIPNNGKHNISTSRPEQWKTFDEVVEIYANNPGKYNGIGKLIRKEECIAVGDIDNGNEIPKGWPATYTEVSPSGNGLHIFWSSAATPDTDLSKPHELYFGNAPRFITVTGVRHGRRVKVQRVNGELADYISTHSDTNTNDRSGKNTTRRDGTRSKRTNASSYSAEDIPEIESYTDEDIISLGGRISKSSLDFLLEGGAPGERSELLWRVINEMYSAGLDPQQALSALVHSQALTYAAEKRGEDKCVEYLWQECCRAADKQVARVQQQKDARADIAGSYKELHAWIEEASEDEIIDEYCDKLNAIEARSPLQDELILKKVKTKTGSSMAAIRTEYKTACIAAGEEKRSARTHMDIADDFYENTIRQLYPNGVVITQGSFYGAENNIWQKIDSDRLKLDIGRSFSEPRCCRGTDYTTIKNLVLQQIEVDSDPDFFISAPPGIATPKGFYRIDDEGKVHREPLDAQTHRAQFVLPAAPTKKKGKLLNHFLDTSIVGPEKDKQRLLLQECVGATLFQLMAPKQKVILLLGETDSGKSMLQRLMQKFFPIDLRSSVSPTNWHEATSRVNLAGSLLNIAGDVPKTKILHGEIFNKITGNDTFDIKRLYEDKIDDITNTATHIFSSNFLPATHHNKAFFKRWIIIRFNESIKEKDKIVDLEGRIFEEELGSLLQWAMEGAQRLIKQGDFTETATMKEVKAEWEKESSSVLEFLHDEDTVEITNDKKDVQNTTYMYLTYVAWCKECSRKPMAKQNSFRLMEKELGARVRRSTHRVFSGVRIIRPIVTDQSILARNNAKGAE